MRFPAFSLAPDLIHPGDGNRGREVFPYSRCSKRPCPWGNLSFWPPLDDARVRPGGDHQVDVFAGEAVDFSAPANFGQGPHGDFEKLVPRHLDAVQVLVHRLVERDGLSPSRHVEKLPQGTVRVQVGGKDPRSPSSPARITAPAPSPKRTQVARSTSPSFDMISAPGPSPYGSGLL